MLILPIEKDWGARKARPDWRRQGGDINLTL
jgi:hypothetical protein